MKKALFLDRAPSSERVPLQVQNLDTFDAMATVTLHFLQHNAQCQAGVTVTPNNKRGPDDMEIDALTRAKTTKRARTNRPKPKGRRQAASCDGGAGHMAKDCWFKEANNGSGPNNMGKKRPGKRKKSVNEISAT